MSDTMAISIAISDGICHIFRSLFCEKQYILCSNITFRIVIEISKLFRKKKLINIFKYFSRNRSESDIIFQRK